MDVSSKVHFNPICRMCTNRTSPECPKHSMQTITPHTRLFILEILEGFEPPTEALEGLCSSN